MKGKRFVAWLILSLAAALALTIPAAEESKVPQKDQYLIFELQPVVFETDTQEALSGEAEETLESASESNTEAGTEEGERILEIVSRTDTALLYLSEEYSCDDFSVTGIRADEPVIARLLARTDDYEGYDSIALYDIISYHPESDGGYLFTLQLDAAADVSLYQILDGTLQKSGLDVLYTEDVYNRLPAVSYTSGTNHWLVISLEAAEKEGSGVSETDTNEMTADKETEEAAESLEGKTEPDQEITAGSHQAASVAVHTHKWVPVITTVHHDASYRQVWYVDQDAYDETVVDQTAYDEQALITPAWDEPVHEWVGICNKCGHVFQPGEDIDVHMGAGCWSGWHDEWMQTGLIHHDAIYQTVHHEAVTHVVHHDEAGHYENMLDQAAWNETVITGYTCSECGEVQ